MVKKKPALDRECSDTADRITVVREPGKQRAVPRGILYDLAAWFISCGIGRTIPTRRRLSHDPMPMHWGFFIFWVDPQLWCMRRMFYVFVKKGRWDLESGVFSSAGIDWWCCQFQVKWIVENKTIPEIVHKQHIDTILRSHSTDTLYDILSKYDRLQHRWFKYYLFATCRIQTK